MVMNYLLYFLEAGDTCAMSLTCCMAKSKSNIRAVADKDSSLVMIPHSKICRYGLKTMKVGVTLF